MTVKSTSITATTPMTSLARRDNVGTGTGGRMATVDLLSLLRPTRWRARRPDHGCATAAGPDAPGDRPTTGPRSAPSTVPRGGRVPAAAPSTTRLPARGVNRRGAAAPRGGRAAR